MTEEERAAFRRDVMQRLEKNPKLSHRELAVELGVSSRTVDHIANGHFGFTEMTGRGRGRPFRLSPAGDQRVIKELESVLADGKPVKASDVAAAGERAWREEHSGDVSSPPRFDENYIRHLRKEHGASVLSWGNPKTLTEARVLASTPWNVTAALEEIKCRFEENGTGPNHSVPSTHVIVMDETFIENKDLKHMDEYHVLGVARVTAAPTPPDRISHLAAFSAHADLLHSCFIVPGQPSIALEAERRFPFQSSMYYSEKGYMVKDNETGTGLWARFFRELLVKLDEKLKPWPARGPVLIIADSSAAHKDEALTEELKASGVCLHFLRPALNPGARHQVHLWTFQSRATQTVLGFPTRGETFFGGAVAPC